MGRALLALAIALMTEPLLSGELTQNQQLVVACYNVNIREVVNCLRNGADVNAVFGTSVNGSQLFEDRWTGSIPAGTNSWTPLIAITSSSDWPPPPAELRDVWLDEAGAARLRNGITKGQREQRIADSVTILLILLSHKCNVDCKDVAGATPLYNAADTSKFEIARMLLGFGANPNTKTGVYIDGSGDTTPLHVACTSKALIELLLAHGADATAKDSNGRTPSQWVELHDDRTFDLVLTPKGWRVQARQK